MITCVCLNPALDRTLTVPNLQLGQVNSVTTTFEQLGGKGFNVCRDLTQLGVPAQLTGFVGKDDFAYWESSLKKLGLANTLFTTAGSTRLNIKLIDPLTNQTTDINQPGFCVSPELVQQFFSFFSTFISHSRFVVCSGSLPLGAPTDMYRQLLSELPTGCKGVLDSSKEAFAQGLKASPFLIKPNLAELEEYAGQNLTQEAAINVARSILEEFQIQYVLLSLGEKGCLLVSPQATYYAQALSVPVHSTVGAGDALLAAFLQDLHAEKSPTAALASAVAWSAVAVQKIADIQKAKEEFCQLLPQVQIHQLSP